MGRLTGFSELNGNALESAKNGFNISLGNSPFQDNVVFTVNGFTFTVPMEDGKEKKDARTLPVLVTSVGNLYLSLLLKRKVTSDGRILTPDGTLNQVVREIIGRLANKTDGEILQSIVDDPRIKGHNIKVKRTSFIMKSRLGSELPSDLIEFDIQ